jgi:putative phosphoribosyl transferase
VKLEDRRSAGVELGLRLKQMRLDSPVVVGMPRGGMPVAFEVARALGAPLDVFVARKIGAPNDPELGMGAVAEGGTRVLNEDVLRARHVSRKQLDKATIKARAEVDERVARYRNGRPRIPLDGRTIVLVDDGIATGGTATAALRALHTLSPLRLILAVPVAPEDTIRRLEDVADEVVCLLVPDVMFSLGGWYEDFRQVTDDEVLEILAREIAPGRELVLHLPGGEALVGDLGVPADARALVVFAHGSGSSRHSPRNVEVAHALGADGFATLLFDLLTPLEAERRANVFNIDLLTRRLVAVSERAADDLELRGLPLNYFGASTGAAAALTAAAALGDGVAAGVSRGGRPDLSTRPLAEVTTPVLLIVGSADAGVLELNRQALRELGGEAQLALVPGATHLFEEPGALNQVAQLASDWFAAHVHTAMEAAA